MAVLIKKGIAVTTDQELVDRVQAGDSSEFAHLVRRYERGVLGVVQAEVRDPVAAQRVAKTALLRACRRLTSLPNGTAVGPWLLKIARRQSIEAVRRLPTPVGARSAHSPAGMKDSDGSMDMFDPEWIEHEHLLGLVVRLPAEHRQMICLRYFDHHSLPDIGRYIGAFPGQVGRLIVRSIGRLQWWWIEEQEVARPNRSFEHRLESTGVVLRERESLVDAVMADL